MQYLNFDLTIESAGDGYKARVTDSPAGQASVDFTPPFSDLELENFVLRMGRTRREVRRIDSPEASEAKKFGGKLFRQVFAGDVLGCLRSSLDEATRQEQGLRLRLHLNHAKELADLPWEFLFHDGLNRFLGLSIDTPIVRYLDFPERIQPLLITPPLRVLLMMSSPRGYSQLDVVAERERISKALADLESRGLVVVDWHEHPTLSSLQRLLRSGTQYHIFHFMGHGGFDKHTEDGVLLFEDDNGDGQRVSGQDLGTLLHDHRSLRLAILNACEGARTSRTDPFAGTAQSLVQQGIPAVIAMQFEVSDTAAICFAHEFYDSIATNYPVDAALAEARKAISSRVSPIEWGTPVLYMRSADGRIFDIPVPERSVQPTAPAIESRQPGATVTAGSAVLNPPAPVLPGPGRRLPWILGVLAIVATLVGVSLISRWITSSRSITTSERNASTDWIHTPGPDAADAPGSVGTVTQTREVSDVALSVDGKWIATADGNSHTARLWDAGTGKMIKLFAGDSVASAVAFSRDSRRVATDSAIFDIATGERVARLDRGGYDVAFSPDGKLLATASGYTPSLGTRIFDQATGNLLKQISDEYAQSLAFSNDGTLLAVATGYLAKGVRVWRMADYSVVRTLPGPSSSVAFSTDGKWVATAGGGTVRIFNTSTGEARDLSGKSLAFRPDGILAITNENDQVGLYEPASGRPIKTLDIYATAFTFSPDGKRVITVDPNGSVQVTPLE